MHITEIENLAVDLNEVLERYNLLSHLTGIREVINGKEYLQLKDNTYIRYDLITGLERLTLINR